MFVPTSTGLPDFFAECTYQIDECSRWTICNLLMFVLSGGGWLLQNNVSADNPISACSSSEVGAAATSPHSDQGNAAPPGGSTRQIHIEENQTDPDLSTSKPERLTQDDQDGSQNAPGTMSSPQSQSLKYLLNNVLKYYVHVICEAGRGWDYKKAGHRTDVDLLRETMEQLGHLAAQWTFIMDAMMVCNGIVLNCPNYTYPVSSSARHSPRMNAFHLN